ncbi:hypothetical protein [Nocardia donostiensis]|uniref:Uncharacterized protein n=1 Tax=Nocardia donostiensis TaxID=1538463 RepID=A0A1V2TEY4_9NOCA|nr:hypothetical protein [Nocardia donostiensis]ONM47921.1 hypothetical protein B0T46_14865 [Nocardia donostiensis]OQS13164.1 hypothetical protein B0T36_21745 [Nocardia donostiensis]OQS21464.1 hypothetical protein B0T44_07470 [Nocardia donostiensis]
MSIYIDRWSMTSDITPETAERAVGGPSEVWRLSWLPGRLLSFDQARAGMELDEIVSDPALVHDRMALARGAMCADALGIIWEQAVLLLYKRMAARLAGPAVAAAG